MWEWAASTKVFNFTKSNVIQSNEQLEEILSEPTPAVVEMMGRLDGDILFLGVAGKIGPSLARMARRASDLAGVQRRVIGVSRFSNPAGEARLRAGGIETIRCDLLDEEAVGRLPRARNVIYLAGFKFGSTGAAATTWAMNAYLPGVVCRRFLDSRIVAYSTGTVYGLTPADGGGAKEAETPRPVGEYAMSCLGRERVFEYFGRARGIPIALIRLFYACDLRYGVLVDLAGSILDGRPIDLGMGFFNIIWQGDSNAMTLLALDRAASPAAVFNLTGPEVLGIREVAEALGRRLGVAPKFQGVELGTACLGNTDAARKMFGPPRVSAGQLIEWVADWMKNGGPTLGKPTHFETRDGRF